MTNSIQGGCCPGCDCEGSKLFFCNGSCPCHQDIQPGKCCEKCLAPIAKDHCLRPDCPCHAPSSRWEEYTLGNAVRDITSVSVAPAAKSEVKRILEKLLASEIAKTKAAIVAALPEEESLDGEMDANVFHIRAGRNEALRQVKKIIESV